MATSPSLPGVSYVMPVLNEAPYIEAAVQSILDQQYPGPSEIILALGPSTDGTTGIVESMTQRDPRIRIVHNEGTDIPIGLNLAIAASRFPVIVRVDAHTQLMEGYTARGVATLERTGAASLGGVMEAVGRPGVQAAVARAYNSRFGLGGGAYHGTDAPEGPAESAYMGIMRADVLRELGGYDETLRRGEDWELNFRLRRAGHLVWFDPGLRVSYWPRSTYQRLARQFTATGIWRGELVRRLGGGNSARYFAPPLLLIATIASLVLLPLHLAGLLHGWVGIVLGAAYLGPGAYLLLLIGVGLVSGGGPAQRLRYMAVLAIMHYAWAAGFLLGVVRGAGDAVDTSRTES
ncbi:glycosyltransferase family 2 protein [Homoserinibacter sp. YIM 151385]|uniref:glycosyltransferase family 2 protein n=1 Tax=Homoserinibacter sp. YIM 151385 TaxID=2985506 RepID=UPI0022F0B1E1|nr:glycosyltransferase family 2 protein [Homoserinibacter sp. YIM 151385]WBU38163.1 glycosyltransferase family 2 protein [Homoserinibacter sp. YIM 151385]